MTAGVNWYAAGDNRLSLDFERRRDRAHAGTGNLLIAQVQAAF